MSSYSGVPLICEPCPIPAIEDKPEIRTAWPDKFPPNMTLQEVRDILWPYYFSHECVEAAAHTLWVRRGHPDGNAMNPKTGRMHKIEDWEDAKALIEVSYDFDCETVYIMSRTGLLYR